MTGAEVKELRKKLKLSQEKFSKLIGTSRVTISYWENDFYNPSNLALEKLNKIKEENSD